MTVSGDAANDARSSNGTSRPGSDGGTSSHIVEANLVDLDSGRIVPTRIEVVAGRVATLTELDGPFDTFVLPGFVDAHVHVESSMLVPTEFARAAVVHGTVAAVCDPHEIANVLGVPGVRFMLDNAASTPFCFAFGAPSCVPATPFETSGASIPATDVRALLDDERISYLAEVMDFPGVLDRNPEVMAKIRAAQDRDKPVDGHAPGLRGALAASYIDAGISTDHECTVAEEALEKIAHGARILIREGSAARNFDALVGLIDSHPEACMFCSDDKHPDELLAGHINELVARAVKRGSDLIAVLRCACVHPVRHYDLDVGLLRPGDSADFIEVEDLERFRVVRTFLRGRLVADSGRSSLPSVATTPVNQFRGRCRGAEELRIRCESSRVNVIEAIDGELITHRRVEEPRVEDGLAVADPDRDILKIAVVNRYEDAPAALAFVRGFGLERGAIASSVAHDSHNVIAIGATDEDLAAAINAVVDQNGGLAVVCGDERRTLPLPVAGLMSTDPCADVAHRYSTLDGLAKELGASLRAPFMTLSFLALLVIPEIKISDKGLFDAERFEFLPLFVPDPRVPCPVPRAGSGDHAASVTPPRRPSASCRSRKGR